MAGESPVVKFTAPIPEPAGEILSPDAISLLAMLQQRFNARRLELLAAREARQTRLDAGEFPDFLTATADIRAADWRVAEVPADLKDRRVEITGPVDRKMVINALNAPVKCFMADFEDSCSPTWENILLGQVNLRDAIDRTISFTNESTGKRYELAEETATLIVRPRGWHLTEKHCLIDGERASASIFDFALYLANNHESLRAKRHGSVLLSAQAGKSPRGAAVE